MEALFIRDEARSVTVTGSVTVGARDGGAGLLASRRGRDPGWWRQG